MRYTILNPEHLDDKQISDRKRTAFLIVRRTSWIRELFKVAPDDAEILVEYDLGSYPYYNRNKPPVFKICFRSESSWGLSIQTPIPRGLTKAVTRAWKEQTHPVPKPWKPTVDVPKATVVDHSDRV